MATDLQIQYFEMIHMNCIFPPSKKNLLIHDRVNEYQ